MTAELTNIADGAVGIAGRNSAAGADIGIFDAELTTRSHPDELREFAGRGGGRMRDWVDNAVQAAAHRYGGAKASRS